MERLPPPAAAFVVFTAAAAVLVLEILAARLMAPYVGVSLNTYTGIIGTVLAGIAAGTWAGGRAADALPPRQLLGPVLAVGGVLALASPPLMTVLGKQVQGSSLIAIVALSGATVFLPAFVLSAVTPIVVKMQLHDLSTTGRVVGRLSAWATAGALVGTYGTGFVLSAHLHTRVIVSGIGVLLIVVGGIAWWRLARGIAPIAAALVLVLAIGAAAAGASVKGPCRVESAYFCIRVLSGPPGTPDRLLMLDNLAHSWVDLRNPRELGLAYVRVLASAVDAIAPSGEPVATLHIGGGAFTLPRYIDSTRPGSSNTVIEIDPAVVDTAKTDFGLRETPSIDARVGDARVLARDERPGSFDFVIGDAFSGRSVPWHLTTREFLEELRGLLRPGGVYLMNVIDPQFEFARAEAKTLRQVFRHVALLRMPGATNYILVASNRAFDAGAIAGRAGERDTPVVAVTGDALDRLIGAAEVLDDDFAPVDQLLN